MRLIIELEHNEPVTLELDEGTANLRINIAGQTMRLSRPQIAQLEASVLALVPRWRELCDESPKRRRK